MTIDTRRVRGRRRLRFRDYDAVLADVRHLQSVPHHFLGNWSLAQMVKHLGQVMHGSIDGSSTPFKFPLASRIVGRFLLRPYLLNVAIPRGIKLPRTATRSFMFDHAEFDEAIDRMETGIARLRSEPKRVAHPLIGPLSVAQWDKFHLRHCELHLGFVVPD